MFKHRSKASDQQPGAGSTAGRSSVDSSLIDVTFHEKRYSQASIPKGRRSGPRRSTQPANTAASPLAEDQPPPSTLVGLGWARTRASRRTEAQRSLPRSSRNRRRSWLWRLLVIIPLLLALGIGIRLLLTASYFEVQHIQVDGTHSASLIAAIQRLHLDGVNIFLANTQADAAAIKALPPVADASVTRILPNTLQVHVVERQPVLIWQVGTQKYSIDAGGVIIAQVQQSDGLPVISDEHQRDLHGHPFAPGGAVDPAIVQMARQLLEEIPATIGITHFTLRDTMNYGMVLISADGWQARFGGPDNLPLKIKALAAILQLVNQQGQQLALVDLRFGFYPYYRLKGAGT